MTNLTPAELAELASGFRRLDETGDSFQLDVFLVRRAARAFLALMTEGDGE